MIATISAVNKYSSLLRVSSSSVRNDLRLGGDEAPPSIISVYLGTEIENTLYDILDLKREVTLKHNDFNINNLSFTPKDSDDRNRTSPFAYTGGKFEFRMLGSMQSAADCNIVLNTIVGEELKLILNKIKNISNKNERISTLKEILKELFISSERILYSGDNYSKEWIEEAKRRGLQNSKTYYNALMYAKESKDYNVLLENNILNKMELKAIFDICLEDVLNTYTLEIKTVIDMLNKDVIPSCMKELDFEIKLNEKLKNDKIELRINKLNDLLNNLFEAINSYNEFEQIKFNNKEEKLDKMYQFIPKTIEFIRKNSDEIEKIVSKENWDLPTYEQMFRALD